MLVPIPVCVEILLPASKHPILIYYSITCVHDHEELKIFNTPLQRFTQNKALPKMMMENPITNTRLSTFPTAWVSGATLSRVLVANCKIIQTKIVVHFKPFNYRASLRYKNN